MTNHLRELQVDFSVIQNLTSNEQGLFTQQEEAGITFDQAQKLDSIKFIIDHQLSEIERLCLLLFMVYKKKQKTIGNLIGLSQEECCYYKKRAYEKIRRYLVLNTVDTQEMETFMRKFCTEKQVQYFVEYFKHPYSVYVMKKLGCKSTTTVLTGVKRGLNNLERQCLSSNKETAKKAKFYVSIFKKYIKGKHLYCASKKKVPQELG